jgi:hypothetical protein
MRGNVDASDCFVMSLEFILKCEVASRPSVELDVSISCNRKCLPVGGEGVVGDWVMEEMVNFRTGHCEFMVYAIGGALYYRCTGAESKFVVECVMR